jgi:hypothetical protein
MTASVHVHGTPGQSLLKDGARKYGAADASRGRFIERAVARALEHWLSRRPDCARLHLFHDLRGFHAVTGHGYGPISLGTANIDHVVLSGAQWLLIDAKGNGCRDLDDRLARPRGAYPCRWDLRAAGMARQSDGAVSCRGPRAHDGPSWLAGVGAAGRYDPQSPPGCSACLEASRNDYPDQRGLQRVARRGVPGTAAAGGSGCRGGPCAVPHCASWPVSAGRFYSEG